MFSLFAKVPPEACSSEEACAPGKTMVDKAEICADVIRFIDLLAEGKYEEALHVAEGGDLPRLKQQIEKLRNLMQTDLERSVTLSIDINEAAFSGAELSRAITEINTRAQGMAAAVEELTTSAASILSTSNLVNGKTHQMKMNVSSGMSAANELLGAMQRIEDTVAQSNRKVEELVASTASIDKILYIISDISEKTKLLALNATIEAARAGEAGKGFAVVASEVKTLAAQTATSADEIGQRIKSLVSVTKEISDIMQGVSAAMHEGQDKLQASNNYMNEIHRDSDEISQQMEEVSHNLQEQEMASREISSSVAVIAEMTHTSVASVTRTLDAMDRAEKSLVEKLTSFASMDLQDLTINLAKSDHVIWKKRLASMAAGRTNLDPNALADHHNCRLGKWYYSEKADAYKKKPAYAAIEEYHMLVHKHGIEAARKYNARDLDGSLAEIAEAEKASVYVLDYLEKMKG